MAKRGVDDAMFCEACGAHRDQLGLAGDDIRTCPGCDRATCSNCWNQVAGACLTCRAFALPIARPRRRPEPSGGPAEGGDRLAIAASPRRRSRRRTPTPADSSGPPSRSPIPSSRRCPAWSSAARRATPARPSTSAAFARFGHIRIGRVIRATAIGSVLAVSIAAVGFAGVMRLGPPPKPPPSSRHPRLPRRGRAAAIRAPIPVRSPPRPRARPSAPVDAAVTTGPDDRGVGPASNGAPSGNDPTDGPPPATNRPGGTAAPTAGATATPTADARPPPRSRQRSRHPTRRATPTPEPTRRPTPGPDPTPTPTRIRPTPEPNGVNRPRNIGG